MENTTQRLLAVVVVYCKSWNEVACASYLLEQFENPRLSKGCDIIFQIERLIVYDNSPNPMAMPLHFDERIDYKHNPGNGGTRCAYDFALAEAVKRGYEWVLLLDDDTHLPFNFLSVVSNSCNLELLNELDVFLPRVDISNKQISPSYISNFGSIVQVAHTLRTSNKLPIKGITGIASGSIIRTSALVEIPQLPSMLWLDFVDHWIFHQLNLRMAKYLIIDITLQHKLSILNMSEVSRERLFSILDGESVFIGSLGYLAKAIYPFRLLLRFIRFVITCPPAARNMAKWFWLRFLGCC